MQTELHPLIGAQSSTVADKAINRRCGLHNIWVQDLNFPRVLLQ